LASMRTARRSSRVAATVRAQTAAARRQSRRGAPARLSSARPCSSLHSGAACGTLGAVEDPRVGRRTHCRLSSVVSSRRCCLRSRWPIAKAWSSRAAPRPSSGRRNALPSCPRGWRGCCRERGWRRGVRRAFRIVQRRRRDPGHPRAVRTDARQRVTAGSHVSAAAGVPTARGLRCAKPGCLGRNTKRCVRNGRRPGADKTQRLAGVEPHAETAGLSVARPEFGAPLLLPRCECGRAGGLRGPRSSSAAR
jgi:hypothetical protein